MTQCSQYPGVGYHPQGRWTARVSLDGRRIWLGYHDDEIAAARTVNAFWATWIETKTASGSQGDEAKHG